jgi:hypothetical protein
LTPAFRLLQHMRKRVKTRIQSYNATWLSYQIR